MVYQGTVWGPPLWNVFYKDAAVAIRMSGFCDIVYADDLNAFRIFHGPVSNHVIKKSVSACQANLHAWGGANQVAFDAGKESAHIISRSDPDGTNFKILGINFDTRLHMHDCIYDCAAECAWKLRTLLRTRRFHNDAAVVRLYKSHILPYIEYRTPGIAHASVSELAPVDRIQDRLLRHLGISDRDALMHFHLAPLRVRRTIAILGVIHRTVLGIGPPHFQRFFNHGPLHQYGASSTPVDARRLAVPCHVPMPAFVKRSAFGLIPMYNALGMDVKSALT
eukprot:2826711-Karenia_brevis.AAC.1